MLITIGAERVNSHDSYHLCLIPYETAWFILRYETSKIFDKCSMAFLGKIIYLEHTY